MSVCPSVRKQQLGFHRTDFNKIFYLNIFLKLAEEVQVSFKFDQIMASLHEDQLTFMIISRSVLRMKKFPTKVAEKIKTHILCSMKLFENSCYLCDNLEKNMVKLDRPQMSVQHGACALHAGNLRLRTEIHNM